MVGNSRTKKTAIRWYIRNGLRALLSSKPTVDIELLTFRYMSFITNVHSAITSCDSPNKSQVHGTCDIVPSGPRDSWAQRVLNMTDEVHAEVHAEAEKPADEIATQPTEVKEDPDAESDAGSVRSDKTTQYWPDEPHYESDGSGLGKRKFSQMPGDSSTEEVDETPPEETDETPPEETDETPPRKKRARYDISAAINSEKK